MTKIIKTRLNCDGSAEVATDICPHHIYVDKNNNIIDSTASIFERFAIWAGSRWCTTKCPFFKEMKEINMNHRSTLIITDIEITCNK